MRMLLVLLVLPGSGCALLSNPLPEESVPLIDMEEPPSHFKEPDDERARRELGFGSFTGVQVAEARETLDEMLEEADGILVTSVVENSPGDVAGIEVGDLLLELIERNGERVQLPIRWPGQWREAELEARPDSVLRVLIDRAGLEQEASIRVERRLHPADRQESARYPEEQRVGVVFRTATEVEARSVGLPPGGGVVIVGLARTSPWRVAGLRYGDLIVEANGDPLHDPQQLLNIIEGVSSGKKIELGYFRDGEKFSVGVSVTRRKGELRRIQIPLLFGYSRERGVSETSFLLGLFHWRRTPVAWDFRLFWLLRFSGGESDRLQEIEE